MMCIGRPRGIASGVVRVVVREVSGVERTGVDSRGQSALPGTELDAERPAAHHHRHEADGNQSPQHEHRQHEQREQHPALPRAEAMRNSLPHELGV